MKWFRVDVGRVLSTEFLDHEPKLRAGWLSLLALAADHEAGGLIKGCRRWSPRAWGRAAGLTPALVGRLVDAELARWSQRDGDDLEVAFYDEAGEEKSRARSSSGRKAAITRWHPDADASAAHAQSQCSRNARNGDVDGNEDGDGTSEGAGAPAQPQLAGLATSPPSPPSDRAGPRAGSPAKRVTDHFTARYRDRTGAAPTWKRERHFANLKGLLAQHGDDADLLIARIDVLFDAPPQFLAASVPDFDTFYQHFDKLAAPGRAPRPSRAADRVSPADDFAGGEVDLDKVLDGKGARA